jgi:hypothetical protein
MWRNAALPELHLQQPTSRQVLGDLCRILNEIRHIMHDNEERF